MSVKKEEAIWAQRIDDATEKGKEEGIKIGAEWGKVEGIAEGQKQAKIAVAKNLLKAGMSINVIAEATALSIDEIEQLRENSNIMLEHTISYSNVKTYSTKKIKCDGITRIKTEFLQIISATIDKKFWTQACAAQVLGINQPRVSHIKHKKIAGLGLKRLFLFLHKLDFETKLLINSQHTIDASHDIKEIKVALMRIIVDKMQQGGWRQREASKILKLDQPKVSHIHKLETKIFSVERLIELLFILDFSIEILIEEKSSFNLNAV